MNEYRKSMNEDCEETVVVEHCSEDYYKDNCDPVYSEELEVECGNIYTADCVAILAEKIYDCTTLQNLQFIDKKHNFIIDSYVEDDPRYSYRDGDLVCIDSIALCYDHIGIKDDATEEDAECDCNDDRNITISYNLKNKCLEASVGLGYIAGDTVLYDEFEGVISNVVTRRCNVESITEEPITKARVFKAGINYYVHNLSLKIRGRIGCRRFTGIAQIEADYDGVTKITSAAEEGLNFCPVNLCGRISRPVKEKTKLKIELDTCLSADCVETNDLFDSTNCDREGNPQISAVVGYSFLVNHKLRHTTEEELAVFVSNKSIQCDENDNDLDCLD